MKTDTLRIVENHRAIDQNLEKGHESCKKIYDLSAHPVTACPEDEIVWRRIFIQSNANYISPKLTLKFVKDHIKKEIGTIRIIRIN